MDVKACAENMMRMEEASPGNRSVPVVVEEGRLKLGFGGT